MVTAPARRLLVRSMVEKGLSERRALTVMRMSASALRYEPRADRNVELREQIAALAHRHRRYGVGMIHLKLRQKGLVVNYKRVERLYQEAGLQVRRRKRKKVPIGERQPLLRPSAANEVWSMDFVFDRTAEGRVIKCLTIVDDATHEAVAIEVERAISGQGVSRVLDRLAMQRGLPRVISWTPYANDTHLHQSVILTLGRCPDSMRAQGRSSPTHVAAPLVVCTVAAPRSSLAD